MRLLLSVFLSCLPQLNFLQAEDGDVQTSEIVRQYVYEFGVDEMVLIRDVDERGEELSSYFIHQNTQGSVSALSLSNGDVIERYEYGSYGDPKIYDREGQVQSESQVRNSYFYTNRRIDEETGLYYFRHRYLDPKMGRFISRDPLGTWADGFNYGNAYSYAGNDPLNKLDPFGLLSETNDGQDPFGHIDSTITFLEIILFIEFGKNPLTEEQMEQFAKQFLEDLEAGHEFVSILSAHIKSILIQLRAQGTLLIRNPNESSGGWPGYKGRDCQETLNELGIPPRNLPNEEKMPPIELPGRNFGPIVMPLPPREEGQIKLPDLTHPAREPQFEDLVVGGSYAGDGYISEGEFPLEVHITQSCLGLLLYKVRFPLPKGTPKRTPRPVGGSTKAGSLSGSLQGASLYPYPPGRKGGYPEGVLPPGSEDNVNSGFGTLTIRTGP